MFSSSSTHSRQPRERMLAPEQEWTWSAGSGRINRETEHRGEAPAQFDCQLFVLRQVRLHRPTGKCSNTDEFIIELVTFKFQPKTCLFHRSSNRSVRTNTFSVCSTRRRASRRSTNTGWSRDASTTINAIRRKASNANWPTSWYLSRRRPRRSRCTTWYWKAPTARWKWSRRSTSTSSARTTARRPTCCCRWKVRPNAIDCWAANRSISDWSCFRCRNRSVSDAVSDAKIRREKVRPPCGSD